MTTNPPNEILCPRRLPLLFYGVKGFMLTASPSTTALTQGWGCHFAGSTSVIYEANMIAILLHWSQSPRPHEHIHYVRKGLSNALVD